MCLKLPHNYGIIDVGAHIGDLALPLAKALENSGRSDIIIYAIDPSKQKCEFMQRIARKNMLKNIKIINTGLTDKDDIIYYHNKRDDENTGGLMWYENTNSKEIIKDIGPNDSENMNFKTLDSLVNSGEISHKIGIYHIDVEFMEIEVLKGSKMLVDRDKPILLIESFKMLGTHIDEKRKCLIEDDCEIISYLKNKNYKFSGYMSNEDMIFKYETTIENYNSTSEGGSGEIPYILHQTYISKDSVPDYVFQNIKKYSPNYEYRFYNDSDCLEFIKSHFDNDVLEKYKELKGAHQADLFRYCILYEYGGVYLDIKTELILDLNNIIKNRNYIYTAIACENVNNVESIYQGVIATPPKQKIFLRLIDFILKTDVKDIVKNYHIFTTDFFNNIKEDTILNSVNEKLNEGKENNYYLFSERCTFNESNCYDGLDKVGICSYIYDGEKKIIKTRYSAYPF